GSPRRATAPPRAPRAPRGPAARPCAVLASSPPLPQTSLSGSPCGACDGRTTGSTCAARCGRACCAATYWSGSCVACTARKRASLRFERLRGPLTKDAFRLGFGRARSGVAALPPQKKTSPLACGEGERGAAKDSAQRAGRARPKSLTSLFGPRRIAACPAPAKPDPPLSSAAIEEPDPPCPPLPFRPPPAAPPFSPRPLR